ncbi:hypothetical protein GL263_24970 [Streptomyces durbertensis]|uniref:Bacterial transcriptional activator domain-containing protein n=1 Tax=Streptomyces durbertensis TaxID=2448886 RepID=A0ABR6ENT3_9ACTN|nr:hypothetical protein [Streptomyces durbertensis]
MAELCGVLARHPLREDLWRQLILLLFESGRQADALDEFHRCRRALRAAGAEPGAELREIHQRVLGHDPGWVAELGRAAPAPAARQGAVRAWVPHQLLPEAAPFVGRESSLAALDDACEAAGDDGRAWFSTGRPAWASRRWWCAGG